MSDRSNSRVTRIAAALLASLASMTAVASDLGAWSGYAMSQMLPEFEWASREAAAPTVFDAANGPSVAGTAGLVDSILPDLSFSLTARRGFDDAGGFDFAPTLLPRLGPGIHRSLLAPGITRSFGDDASLELTALFARQQYATWGLGTGISGSDYSPINRETSTGQGAAITWRDGLTPTISYRAAYQSRIDMDPLESVRGVYADAADFDMPATATLGFDWQFAPHWQFGIDASRVAYGDIRAFTSLSLPREFLSLLGDGSSPEFGWQDLTVYGAQLAFVPGDRSRFVLRYSTRQQPRPTSSVLDAALADRYSDLNLSFGFEHRSLGYGWWQFVASYSPSQLFLGAPSFADDDLAGRLLEVEALWTYPF